MLHTKTNCVNVDTKQGAVSTRTRTIRSISLASGEGSLLNTDLDSHADSCVAGANCLMLEESGRKAKVSTFHPNARSFQDIPIVTAATLYQDRNGRSIIVVIHEALWFGEASQTLLCPNQLRANGVIVNDIPRQFDPDSKFSIVDPSTQFEIPLSVHGVATGFTSRKPTVQEVETLPHFVLTSKAAWEPSDGTLEAAEREIKAVRSDRVSECGAMKNQERLIATVRQYTEAIGFAPDESDYLYESATDEINVASDDWEGDGLDGHRDEDVYPLDPEARKIFAITTEERRSAITPPILSRRWGIGLEAAKRTLRATTQAGVRNVLAPTERKLRQRTDHLKFPTLRGRTYTDTMFSNLPSIRGYKAAQVFTNGSGFDHFYPIESKGDANDGLLEYVKEVAIPQILVSDGSKEQTASKFAETCKKYHVRRQLTVPHSPWQNMAEASIRELKQGIRMAMRRTNSPKALWCYCGKWVAAIRRLTAMPKLEHRTPTEATLGSTPDISSYAQFDWYEPVYFYERQATFPTERKCIGRWLGVAENYTDILAFHVLKANGEVIVRKDVWGIPANDMASDSIKMSLLDFDARVLTKIGDHLKEFDPILAEIEPAPDWIFEDEAELDEPEQPETVFKEEEDLHTSEAYDQWLTAKILVERGGPPERATVIGRKKDHNGNPIGRYHTNALLDTREYEIQYEDGTVAAVSSNIIAEGIYSAVDQEGRSYTILKSIQDHRFTDKAIMKENGFTTNQNGVSRPKITTAGVELEVEWRDGSVSWVELKAMKEANPVETAEYAVANKIDDAPAFLWWVKDVLKKRDRIIKKLKTRKVWQEAMKFGLELPRTVEEALEIDRKTGTDFWRKAIEKEMATVMVAFMFMSDDWDPKTGPDGVFQFVKCHMVFDIKMDLTRKARFVAGGHMTDPPKDTTYSSVVSRDSIRIALLIAALNDLEILMCDVQGAYLNAKTNEPIYTVCGLEFGNHRVGTKAIIVGALYGLKSSGARWREHLAGTLREFGFTSCKADPDIWMRPKSKANGDAYWEYVLVYVDDILCISHEPQNVMDLLASKYKLKDGSVGEPTNYLGAKIEKFQIEGAADPTKHCWAMSSDDYLSRAVKEVERTLAEVDQNLKSKVKTPMTPDYRPELDETPELDDKRANYYQGLIGILRWACELGRVDILVDVAKLSRYLASPREGHLQEVFHIFGYLKHYPTSSMVFDYAEPVHDMKDFTECDWAEFYPGASEEVPPGAPECRGKTVTMTCYVDADHAGCHTTRRSQSGILIFVNRAPILWYSKQQNTVETSTFGSEYIAARIAVEMIEGLRYKLRMMGIEVTGPTAMFCDNESVVKNSTRPESTLKKKHNAIAYHRVREAQAAKIVSIAHIEGLKNPADIFTKSLPGVRLRELIQVILW
jgi:Reverse transcriptase (RNA-dependent DNA polymerase)